jgi:hypothetical protein
MKNPLEYNLKVVALYKRMPRYVGQLLYNIN